jgi:hypothetical protein
VRTALGCPRCICRGETQRYCVNVGKEAQEVPPPKQRCESEVGEVRCVWTRVPARKRHGNDMRGISCYASLNVRKVSLVIYDAARSVRRRVIFHQQ